MNTVSDFALELIDLDSLTASDLRGIAAKEGGYEAFKIVPIGKDGRRQSVHAEMIWHNDAHRAGIAWGADADWTDASSPADAADRFFGLNDKEMAN